MTVEIRGEQQSVGQVFSDQYTFVVPPYQRPYLWEPEHADALLDDLLDFMGDGPVNTLDPYFLGSIVLVKTPGLPNAQVVDGQQRLITLTLLLSALRASVPREYVPGISKRIYEEEDRAAGLPARYRIYPKPQDAGFFRDHIQIADRIEALRSVNRSALPDTQRHVAENAVNYLERLAGLPEEQRVRLVQFIIQRCLLVVVSTPDLDSAYRIFSVLNDRGLDLSYADILKAEVIGRVPGQVQQSYTEKWEGVEEDLGRKNFEDVLRHILMLTAKRKLKESILEEFRSEVIKPFQNDSQRFIDEVLVPYSNAFATIQDEDYQHTRGAETVNFHLRWLNRIPDSDWVPSAMFYLAKYRNDPERLGHFFTDLERLAAVLMLRRTNASRRVTRYSELLSAIERGDNLEAATSPLQPSTDECREALQTLRGNIYRQASRIRLYVLLRLDALLANGEATYDHTIISIEHVLPQKVASGTDWAKWFQTQSQRDQWVHRLGNLVLLSRRKNSAASNYSFQKKKEAYFTKDGVSPFALTTQVLRATSWTPQVVSSRQEENLERLKRLWRL